METFILGHRYAENEKKKATIHSKSLFRFTYRSGFTPLAPYHYSDDSGWGCMLRSAQMIMAQTLSRHVFGTGWRIPDSYDERRASAEYCNIVRSFTDYPGPACIYSIHHLVQCGMLYDKLPGEWYGPSAAALVLRDLARLHRRKYRGPLEIYVTNGDTIFITDAEKTFTMTSVPSEGAEPDDRDGGRDASAVESDQEHHRRSTSRNLGRRQLPGELAAGGSQEDCRPPLIPVPDVTLPHTVSLAPFGRDLAHYEEASTDEAKRAHDPFHDPLLNPPPAQEKDQWPGALMVLIPVRLGLDSISPHYFEELKSMLRHPHSVGIIGGKPNRAIYFAGYRGESLLGLDPHTVYSNPSLRDPFPSDDHMHQMHQELEELPFAQLDPSLALGFYFRNREEFSAFCNDIKVTNEQKQAAGIVPLFSVQYAPPNTDFLGEDMFGGSDNEGGQSDPEDEYVFI